MTWDEIVANARILIVDDEPANIRMLERMLQQVGYLRITSTTDPLSVARILATEGADLILLDVHMPQLDGLDLMQQLHEQIGDDGYLPIVIVTADATPEMKLRALVLGAKDFLTKPVDRTELLLRVRTHLETRYAFRHVLEENERLRALVAVV